jgi:hypothetical protein
MRGYKASLTGETKAPSTHNKTSGKKLTLTADDQDIADLNKMGCGDLILSIDCTKPHGKIAFAIAKNSKTKEILSGELQLTFNRLKTRYKQGTTPHLIQLSKEFFLNNCCVTKIQIFL